MPQFDPSTFPTQLIWLAITFVLLVIIMAKAVLPRVAQVLEERQDRIDDDLEKADKLRQEAEAAFAAYEKTLSDSRAKAQAVLRETAQSLAAETAARHRELAERLAEQTRAAEARIDEARKAAIAGLRAVAAEAAGAATAKLIGAQVDQRQIDAAVETVLKDRD